MKKLFGQREQLGTISEEKISSESKATISEEVKSDLDLEEEKSDLNLEAEKSEEDDPYIIVKTTQPVIISKTRNWIGPITPFD